MLIFIKDIPFRFENVFDILFIALLLYFIIKLAKDNVAVQAIVGGLFLFLLYVLGKWFDFKVSNYLFEPFAEHFFIIVVIIFQKEIRMILVLLGQKITLRENKFFAHWKSSNSEKKQTNHIIDEILIACRLLKESKTGALIIITDVFDEDFFDNGKIINCDVNAEIILSIFNKSSRIHDGAIVIFQNKIKSIGCILPLTEKKNLPVNLGLRHRAAIGISEQSNAIAIVVSEQTGHLSIVLNDSLKSNIKINDLERHLVKNLI